MASDLILTMSAWTGVSVNNQLTPILMLGLFPNNKGMLVLNPALAQRTLNLGSKPWPDSIRKLADDLLEAVAAHLNLNPPTEDKQV